MIHQPKISNDLQKFKHLAYGGGSAIAALVILLIVVGFFTFSTFDKVLDGWNQYSEKPQKKGIHLTRILRQFGYGGFIHHFKNYVLRYEPETIAKAQQKIIALKSEVAEFKNMNISAKESAAIIAVEQVVLAYDAKIELVKKLVNSGASQAEIDKTVRVNDLDAFEAFNVLEASWTEMREFGLLESSKLIENSKNLIKMSAFITPILLIVAGLIIWLLHKFWIEITDRANRLNSIVTNTAEGIITIDHSGGIESINPAAQKIFGFSSEELLGQNVSCLIPDSEQASHEMYVNNSKIYAPQIIHQARYLYGKKKSGMEFPMELNVAPMETNKSTMFVDILRDITKRKEQEDELINAVVRAETANRAKSVFLANMSHELRTPLNAIIGFSDALENEIAGKIANVQQRKYVEHIHESGDHLLKLINNILDISAIEAGKLELQEEEVDLSTLLNASLVILRPRAEEKKISFETKMSAKLPKLFIDELRMKQVLVNLLSNAIKFTPDQGSVTLDCDVHNESGVKISICDTGIGMDKECIQTALSKFGQIDRESHKKIEGTGLGLPLTKELIEAHGGTLTITSILGKGTTVTIDVPKERVI